MDTLTNRPSWDDYFTDLAKLVSSRSTCLRRSCGAIIVRNKHLLSTGYNGAPCGTSHCADLGCLRQKLNVPSGERHELCRATHAEQNAIVQAARHGHAVEGADIYITDAPCIICAKLIINAGIEKIYIAQNGYPDKSGLAIALEAGLEVFVRIEKEWQSIYSCLQCKQPFVRDKVVFMCSTCSEIR